MENLITGERIADLLTAKSVEYGQKKMFGGLCFMVDDKMLIGTYKGGVMARVDPAEAENLVNRPGASQMIHGGKPMVGYLFIEPDGYETDTALSFWVEKCLEFNPKAKASGKKKT
ncbi:MAG: TfoX/Sxy family protein [Bacteroidetes bacterium]|nr:TfoX/Sxy family protein [Bacteroidota bacterium]